MEVGGEAKSGMNGIGKLKRRIYVKQWDIRWHEEWYKGLGVR